MTENGYVYDIYNNSFCIGISIFYSPGVHLKISCTDDLCYLLQLNAISVKTPHRSCGFMSKEALKVIYKCIRYRSLYMYWNLTVVKRHPFFTTICAQI